MFSLKDVVRSYDILSFSGIKGNFIVYYMTVFYIMFLSYLNILSTIVK